MMNKLTAHRGTQQGFTMLELLIAIAILGILAAVSLPSFMDTLGRWSANSATRSLASSLNLARSESIKQGLDVSICPTNTGTDCVANAWNGGWIIFVDANGDADGAAGSIDAGDTIIRVYEPLSNMSVTTTPANTNLLEYDRKGFGANAAAVTMLICPMDGNDDNARQLIISLSGRARINEDVAPGTC